MTRCAYSAVDFCDMDPMFRTVQIGEVFVIQFVPSPCKTSKNGDSLEGWAQVHLADDPVGEQCELQGYTKSMYADMGEVWRRADGVMIAATNKVKRRALMAAANEARPCGPPFYTGEWVAEWYVSVPCEPEEALPVERA